MKALTIHQPYARAIVAGRKCIETRSWKTPYRGPLLIHAASRMTAADRREEIDFILDSYIQPVMLAQLGGIIGQVELVDIVPVEKVVARLSRRERALGDYSPGRWAWILREPRARRFVPCRGQQGRIFEVKL